jgi:imidazolonepropionase-like amidohydrolase
MVVLVSYLTSLRIAPWIVRGSALVFVVGAFLPFYLSAKASFDWPKQRVARVVIEGARIVDSASNRIVDGQNVYIENGRVTEITAGASHPDWPRIQAGGHYLLPGLIDVHTHLQSPVEVRTGFQFGYFLKSTISSEAPQRRAYLENGITTVRDLGGPAANSFRMRTKIERREMLGPRLLTSGRLVTSPMGHPVSTIWTPSISSAGAIIATDEKTMIAGLDRNLAEGPPDVVKFIHGTIGRAKEELSVDLMTRGIRWAKDHGLTSVVHAETPAEFEDALRAGATGVEHAAYLDSLPPSLLALVSANRPFIDPTFGEYETSMMLLKLPKSERDGRMKRSYELVRELARSGARIVIGTDAPLVAYGSGFHDEIAHFVCAGFNPSEILAMATSGNAEYIGKAAELGRIAAGFRADLVLAKDNPLSNPETLRRPIWTMLDGQVVVGRVSDK